MDVSVGSRGDRLAAVQPVDAWWHRRGGSAGRAARPWPEAWAFGGDVSPSFAVWGYEDVSGDVLLDVVLSAEPDEPLMGEDVP